MYRAVGLAAQRRGLRLPVEDPAAVAAIAEASRIELSASPEGTRVFLDGEDVSAQIRNPEISAYASAVSAIPTVRRVLVGQQQRLGRERGGVMEGRDIGTKVFPETPFKFFLTADPAIRADRRSRELAGRGTPQSYDQVLQDMRKRDSDDSSRPDSPLTLDGRYEVVDSSGRPVEAVIDDIEQRVRRGI
jgi:cytidylate kinase